MFLSIAVLLVTVSGAIAHVDDNELTPIGSYGPLQLTRRVQKNSDTGYTIVYNNARIHMPKMRLYELLDALQQLHTYASANGSLPLILHGGLQLQQVPVSGVVCVRITDRKNKSTVLTPEQQAELTAALQQEVASPASVTMK